MRVLLISNDSLLHLQNISLVGHDGECVLGVVAALDSTVRLLRTVVDPVGVGTWDQGLVEIDMLDWVEGIHDSSIHINI